MPVWCTCKKFIELEQATTFEFTTIPAIITY